MSAASVTAAGHETKPPARYTEATLVKELEDREIGRPSTYASIIKTILDRGYVYKKGTALVPAWLAFSVVRLLEEHFPRQVSYEFTAAHGGRARRDRRRPQATAPPSSASSTTAPSASQGLHTLVTELGEIDATRAGDLPDRRPRRRHQPARRPLRPLPRGPRRAEGNPTGKRANVPDDLPPDELTAGEGQGAASPTRPARRSSSATHPETGLRVVAKNGRFGPYVTEVLPEDAPKSRRSRAPARSSSR